MIVNYYKAIPELIYSFENQEIFLTIKDYYTILEETKPICPKITSFYTEFNLLETSKMEYECNNIGNGIMNSQDFNTIQSKVINDLRYIYLSFKNSKQITRDELMYLLQSDAFTIDYIILDAYLRKVDDEMRYTYFEKINDKTFNDLQFYTVVLFIINMILEFVNILIIRYLIVNYISKKIKYYGIFIQSLLISYNV